MITAVGRRDGGFTLIEIAVVVVVIAILATLATLGVSRFQSESLDAQRAANANTISEALEEYYDANGEYPSCSQMTQPASTVATSLLDSTSVDALKTPRGEDNSIRCEDLTDPNGDDFFSYTCLHPSDTACGSYTLKYISDRDGDIKTTSSRRSISHVLELPEAFSASPLGPNEIEVEWPAVASARAYELQRSTSSSFAGAVSSTHSGNSTVINGLSANTTYYFRLRAATSIQDVWLDPISAKTSSVPAPTGPIVITASMNGTNARGTTSSGTCSSGTPEREIRYQSLPGGVWSTWTSGSTRDVAAQEGIKYIFETRVRCALGDLYSGWRVSQTPSAEGQAEVIRPVSLPTGITVTASMSGTNARGTGNGSCVSGVKIERQLRYRSTHTAVVGAWSSWTDGSPKDVAANQGHRYYFQQQARCVGTFASSGWTAGSESSIVRPISAPAMPTVAVGTSGNNTSFTLSGVTCPTGTTLAHRYNQLREGYASGWSGATTSTSFSWNTSAQGFGYYAQVQSQCYTTHATSPWSSTRTSSTYVRPVSEPSGEARSFNHQMITPTTKATRTYSWTAPTCGNGAMPIYRYRSYMNMPWRDFNNSTTMFNGWTDWSTYGYRPNNWSLGAMQAGVGQSYPANITVRHRVQYRCANMNTDRQSAASDYVTSPDFKT